MFALEMKLPFELSCPWSSPGLWYFIAFICGIITVLCYKSYTAKLFLVERLCFEIQKRNLKSQKGKGIVLWRMCTSMYTELLLFSCNPSCCVHTFPNPQDPNLIVSPWLGWYMAQPMVIWMGWTGCYTLRKVAASLSWEWPQLIARKWGTLVFQSVVLDFHQQVWTWKQIFPLGLQMRTHPISFNFSRRPQLFLQNCELMNSLAVIVRGPVTETTPLTQAKL